MHVRPALCLVTVVALAAALVPPAHAQLKLPRVSPSANVTQTIGTTDITVAYARPGVKGRVIWGGLVPYDTPWRTGANEATRLTITDPIQFGGKELAAGTYALLTIPGKDAWTVVVNSEKDLWGAYQYKPEKDLVRVAVKPTVAEPQEWMQFTFEDLTPNSANLVLRWETLRVAVPISVNVTELSLASARNAIAAAKTDDWRTPYQAAGYCMTNDVALDEGKQWLEKSLAVRQTYANLGLKARWLMKDGKKAEAVQAAEQAIALAKASADKPDTGPLEKLVEEWKAAK